MKRFVTVFSTLLTLGSPLVAHAARQRVVEATGGLTGASDVVRAAGELGANLDFHGRLTTLGVGASMLVGETRFAEQHVVGARFGFHGRVFLLSTPLAPYVEGGVGIYSYSVSRSDHEDALSSLTNVGPSLGAGLHYRAKSGPAVRLGVAVHYTRIDAGIDGADAEGWLAATLGVSWPWSAGKGTGD